MRRRDFISLFGGALAAQPLAVHAKQGDRVPRIGMLMALTRDDADGQARNEAFLQALRQLGWIDDRNVRIDYRWSAGDADRIRKDAAELVALAPDAILTNGAAGVAPLLEATRTVPVVFVLVADPVGAGFVSSLAHPSGNATGFVAVEYNIGGKWLELLKDMAPSMTRVAVVRDPAVSAGIGLLGAVQSAAASLGVKVVPVDVRDPSGIERAITAFTNKSNGGLLVTASAQALAHRDLIVGLARQYRLPAIYFSTSFVTAGGLASYNPDILDQYRRAAGYIDRILKGEKPADLPVQTPTKYNLVINLKTAKALGLSIPLTLLATADEVIE
jgi:putative ABC transport system substrate-binding protein